MKEKNKINEIISKISLFVALAVLILSAVYMLVLCVPAAKHPVDVIFMGDSICGNYRDDTSIPAVFQSISGMTAYNGGLGGTQASVYDDYSNRSVIQNGTSLVSMARAACFQDYTYVKASLPVLNVASLKYFPESVDNSSHIDFSSAKYIVVEYGLNDFFADKEALTKNEDISTYEGALRYSVRLLKKYYPEAKLVIATPVTSDKAAEDYVDAARNVAMEEQTYVFDAYALGIITKENISEITEDNVHLGEEGRRIYAELLWEYIESTMK